MHVFISNRHELMVRSRRELAQAKGLSPENYSRGLAGKPKGAWPCGRGENVRTRSLSRPQCVAYLRSFRDADDDESRNNPMHARPRVHGLASLAVAGLKETFVFRGGSSIWDFLCRGQGIVGDRAGHRSQQSWKLSLSALLHVSSIQAVRLASTQAVPGTACGAPPVM
jgi:hypothetical protein